MKKGPKAANTSKWQRDSLRLEAEVGDDSDAYNLNDEELEELLADGELTEEELVQLEAEELFDEDYVEDDEDEDDDEDPLIKWDEDEEEFA